MGQVPPQFPNLNSVSQGRARVGFRSAISCIMEIRDSEEHLVHLWLVLREGVGGTARSLVPGIEPLSREKLETP